MEDHDRLRSRPVFASAILDDLAWLGFVPDGALVRQSDRGDRYEAALDGLRRRGLTYACSCSRSEIDAAQTREQAGQNAVLTDELRYPGTCAQKRLAESSGLGIRVRLAPSVERFDDWRHGRQEQRPHQQCGDLLARDRDGNWTYQFAAAVDDWLQEITLVIRGDDLLASTGRQIQLARLLGRREPAAFLHHPLVMKTTTQKLSKSDGDAGVRDLRAKGWSAAEVIGQAAALAHLIGAPRPISAADVGPLLEEQPYGRLA
jgi:glutamyl-tRNA synthetase/glutamyl-Q tRNA(Asp) synthetase